MTSPRQSREAGRELDAEIAELVMGWKQTSEIHSFRTGAATSDDQIRKATEDATRIVVRDASGHCIGLLTEWEPRFGNWQPRYSSQVAAAMQVVEAIRKNAHRVVVEWYDGKRKSRTVDGRWIREEKRREKIIVSDEVRPPQPYWRCQIWTPSAEHYGCWEAVHEATADTLPLAICLAALDALRAASPEEPTP